MATHKEGLAYEAIGLVRETIAEQQYARGGETVARCGQEAGQRLPNGIGIWHAVAYQQSLAQRGQAELHQLEQAARREHKAKVDAGTNATAADPDAQRLIHAPYAK